mmetsp:Transcript_56383/g.132218  ORF Transcript_56383/g.132218 Transcript_56383/m.132218 type:complete len:563 (+) Transcript_56383:140-1828(+)
MQSPRISKQSFEDDEADEEDALLDTEKCQVKKDLGRAYAAHPFIQGHFLGGLAESFGMKLLIMLFATQHLMKGFANSFVGPPTQYLLAAYKVDGPRLGIFGGVVSLPWAMKPIIGLISDCFPVAGYNKGPYILFVSLLGVTATLLVGIMPHDTIGVEKVVACLFIIQLQLSTSDLLSEAKYAEKMQKKPEKGPELMTYVWFGLTAGSLVATLLIGPCIAHFGVKASYILVAVPLAVVMVPVSLNYMEEKQRSTEEIAAARQHMLAQKEACILCLLMFVSTVVLAILGTVYESIELNAAVAVFVGLVMAVSFTLVLKPLIAKVNLFFLLQTACSLNIGGATFYFYTDTMEQYPEGPHFTMEFYTSVLGVTGSLCSMAGVYTYQKYMTKWSYRSLLLAANVALSVLSFADVVMLSRLNVRMGVPDRAFVLGASVFQTLIAQWMWMPGVVLNSQLCPKGMEATMYALLAGCHNLGFTIASSCGALLLKWLNCAPRGQPGESADFMNLWKASALSTVLPLFTLVMLPWMIPDAYQTEKLLDEDDRDATSGSLWKRWWGEKSAHLSL